MNYRGCVIKIQHSVNPVASPPSRSNAMPSFPQRFPQAHTLRTLLKPFLLISLSSILSAQTLKQHSLNPPNDAKPMMRWWWFGPAVEKPEILHELEQMKADGIGGAELAFVYPQVVDDPARHLVNERFLSPPMLDCVSYAASQARRLGLRLDVTLGSGWPYGGPATTLQEAAERVRVAELPLAPGATSLPAFPLAEGESVLSISLVNGEPKHWEAPSAQLLAPGQTKDIAPAT